MENSEKHFYTFGTKTRDNVETYSKTLATMGIFYYVQIEPVSSHNVIYIFVVECTDEELVEIEKKLHKKIKIGGIE